MKTDVIYMPYSKYGKFCGRYWFWYFRFYTGVIGIKFRIFGVDVNIREKNATQKLIAKFIASKK